MKLISAKFVHLTAIGVIILELVVIVAKPQIIIECINFRH